MDKKNVVVLFGGESAEHRVSIQSASSVISALNPRKYNIIPIAISKSGKWLNVGASKKLLSSLTSSTLPVKIKEKGRVDVVFPVLHGSYGEDGTIQGMLEIIGVPYVGAGVLASAIGIDKGIQKTIFDSIGISVLPWLFFSKKKWQENKNKLIKKIKERFTYPVFIKPIDLGSSIGITKAHNKKELFDGINTAFSYSGEVIIEKGINAREIECSVIGNDNPKVSVPGEIIASREFYNYEAKYTDKKSELIIPAELSIKTTKKIQEIAIKAFLAIKCAGMARVDFLIDKKTNVIYLNEINTIPGFTKISMYSKLWQASGVGYSTLLDKLIELAIDQYSKKSKRARNKHVLLCDVHTRLFPIS